MKQMTRSLVVFVFAFLFLVGCTGQQGSSTPGLGGPSGTITWSAPAQKEKPQRGIDQASIYYEGTSFVVWSDFDGGGGGSSSANVHGVRGQGRLRLRDNRHVDFRFETKDGKTGPVTINEKQYDLASGGLFLVSGNGDQVQVKQLKRDLRNVKFERESLVAFARDDADIVAFFARDARKK
jgi:hypothetical protein